MITNYSDFIIETVAVAVQSTPETEDIGKDVTTLIKNIKDKNTVYKSELIPYIRESFQPQVFFVGLSFVRLLT